MIYKSIKVKAATADRLREMKDGSYDTTLSCMMDGSCRTLEPDTIKALEKKFGVSADNLDQFVKSYLVNDHNTRVEALSTIGTTVRKSLLEMGMTEEYSLERAETASSICTKKPEAAISLLTKHLAIANARLENLEKDR